MRITERIQHLQEAITLAMQKNHREPHSLQVIAVSKGQSVEKIREAFAAGITHFAENYWQEAQIKIQSLQDLPITWHFIGKIQSNKTAAIAKQVAWVHSVDNEKIASLLSKHRPASLAPLNICIQVNMDKEPSKGGLNPEEVKLFIPKCLSLTHLNLRGLMTIPQANKNELAQLTSFKDLHNLLLEMNQQFPCSLDTLSMGMSEDYLAAISAGSTFLRIGRAIFGERT